MGFEQKDRSGARRLYVEHGVRNLSRLAAATKITRQTLAKWRVEEDWDSVVRVKGVEPEDILHVYLRQIHRLQEEINELEQKKQVPADSTLKRLALYHKLAKQIKRDFDIGGALIRFANKYIDFVAGLPDFEGKREFLKALDSTLPKFIDFVVHAE